MFEPSQPWGPLQGPEALQSLGPGKLTFANIIHLSSQSPGALTGPGGPESSSSSSSRSLWGWGPQALGRALKFWKFMGPAGPWSSRSSWHLQFSKFGGPGSGALKISKFMGPAGGPEALKGPSRGNPTSAITYTLDQGPGRGNPTCATNIYI